MAYLDGFGYPAYKYFNGSSWQAAVTLAGASALDPVLAIEPTNGGLTAIWIESNVVKYKSALSPYASGNWGSTTTLYNSGTNANLNVQEQAASTSGPLGIWTSGTSNPYNILSDFPSSSDSTPPTTTATGNGGSYTFGSWSSSNVTVGLSCNDTGSGCASTLYCTDTNDSCTPASTYSGTFVVSTSGTSYVRYKSTDNASNAETTKSSTIKIDTAAPTTSDDYAYDNQWRTSNQTITLTPADATSGVSWTKYCTDSSSCSPGGGTTYSAAVEISTEGTTYFRYASQDNATNTQTTVQRTVKIDRTAPTTMASGNGEGYTFGTWSTSNVTVTLSCDDNTGSGCGTTYYCTDTENSCTPSTTYTEGVLISSQGTSYIRYKSTDSVSNLETVKSSTLMIDRIQPTVSIGSSTSDPTIVSPIPITITFSESVTDFSIGDLNVTNGSASNFSGSGANYSADITPSTSKLTVRVNIAGGAATDTAGNNNTAAAEFSRAYGYQRRVIVTQ